MQSKIGICCLGTDMISDNMIYMIRDMIRVYDNKT